MTNIIKRKILYITYDGLTDQLGQSQVLPYICGLKEHGYEFHIISCEKPEKFIKQKAVIEEICKENNITWHPLPYTKSPPVYSTIKDVRAIKKTAFRLDNIHHFDMVHCRGYICTRGFTIEKEKRNSFYF